MFRFLTLSFIAAVTSMAADAQPNLDLSALRQVRAIPASASHVLSMPPGDGQLDVVSDPESAVRSFEAQAASGKVGANQAVTILSTDRVIPFGSAGLDTENGIAVSAAFLFQNKSSRTVNILIEFFDEGGNRISLPTRTTDGRLLLPANTLSGSFAPRQYMTIVVDASRLPSVRTFWVRLRSTLSNSIEVLHETLFSSLEGFNPDAAIPADLGLIASQADRVNKGGWLYYVPEQDRGTASVFLTNGYPFRNVVVTLRARSSNGQELCRALRVVPVATMYGFSPRELDGCFASLPNGFLLEVYSDRDDLFTSGLFVPFGGKVSNLPRIQDF